MRYARLAHAHFSSPDASPEASTPITVSRFVDSELVGGGTRRDVWSSWAGLSLLLLACNAIPVVAAALIGRAAPFQDLAMPWWTPPAEVLGTAAIAFYSAMALATWLVVRQREMGLMMRWATVPFELQLALSGLWLVVLAGLREPTPALALISAQALTLVVTVPRYSTLSRSGGRVLAVVLAATTVALTWTAIVVAMNPPEIPAALVALFS